MQTNAPWPKYTTKLDSGDAVIGEMAPPQSELIKTARSRVEDRLRRAFAERALQMEKIEQHELGPAATADWSKQ